MALKKIVKYGNPFLRKKTAPVKVVDKEIHKLIQDMLETMYHAPGIGLAANQIGVPLSLVVIDLQPNGKRAPLVLINPKIVELKGLIQEEEGCLSIPGFLSAAKRSAYAKVTAVNEKGLPITYVGEGLLARVLQHETDHLSGKFYIDRIPLLRRWKIQAAIRKKKKLDLW